jgi:hypothetical protein
VKNKWLTRRILYGLTQTPLRIVRLFTYFFHSFYNPLYGGSRWRAMPLLLADVFFVFDIYEITTNMYKKNTRVLTQAEILRGLEIFGNSIDFQLVMIDESAEILTRRLNVIYVSANTINACDCFPDDILIHELVHVWQYQNFGAGYIASALKAQNTAAGYNYTHDPHWYQKSFILHFNAEQQGDLVQDYYRIKNGLKPDWGNASMKDLALYERYIAQLKEI